MFTTRDLDLDLARIPDKGPRGMGEQGGPGPDPGPCVLLVKTGCKLLVLLFNLLLTVLLRDPGCPCEGYNQFSMLLFLFLHSCILTLLEYTVSGVPEIFPAILLDLARPTRCFVYILVFPPSVRKPFFKFSLFASQSLLESANFPYSP